MKPKDSSAFPVHGGYANDDPRNQIIGGGLTKREYFAAMAMQGLLTMFHRYETNELKGNAIEALTGDAVAFADELLKQLAK